MKKRIICDTCSAIKLVSFNSKLFQPGVLSQGDIVLHPTLFSEIKRWPSNKKEQYKTQISMLNQVSSTTGLRLNRKDVESQEVIVKATREFLGLSVGRGDVDQLVSALFHDLDLITNDSPFAALAEALDVTVYEAEEAVIGAIDQGILTVKEVQDAVKTWEANGEKQPSSANKKALKKRGIRY